MTSLLILALLAGFQPDGKPNESIWMVSKIEANRDESKIRNQVTLARIPTVIGQYEPIFLNDADLNALALILNEPTPAAIVGRQLELDDKFPPQLAVARMIFRSRYPDYVRVQPSYLYTQAASAIIRGKCPDFSRQDPVLVNKYFQLGQETNPDWILMFIRVIESLSLGKLDVSGRRFDEAIRLTVTGPNVQVRLWFGPPSAEGFICYD